MPTSHGTAQNNSKESYPIEEVLRGVNKETKKIKIYIDKDKNDFFKVISNNVIFLEMFIFLDHWAKNNFSKGKNVLFLQMLIFS